MLCFVIFVCYVGFISAQFQVPEATVEAYDPKGFSVSIPDEEGIRLFAFFGKINEGTDGIEGQTLSGDILEPKFGRWTFTDQSSPLKVGDRIYYATFVEYFDGNKKRGYHKNDQMFTVTRLIRNPSDNDEHTVSSTRRATNSITPTTTPVTVTRNSSLSVTTEVSCEPTPTVVNNGIKPCKGRLLFNEPFNVNLRPKYWNVEYRFAGKPDYEFVLYTNRPEGIYVADKVLVIKPELAEHVYGPNFVEEPLYLSHCTGIVGTADCHEKPDAGFILPPVLSAKITTQNKFSFKYGKIEIRAKLPKGDWLYPILTLNSAHENYGPGYDSGQITIAFSPGNDVFNRQLYGGVILGDSPAARKFGIKSRSINQRLSSAYYRYGVTWKEDHISLTIDDKVYGTIFAPAGGFSTLGSMLNIKNADRWQTGSTMAPFDKEMYITIGVGAGGFNFDDRTDGTKPWRNGERLSVKKFHAAQQNWSSTWNEESMLSVASVKVWAL